MQFADDALLGYPPLEEQNLGQKLSQNLEVGPSLIGLPEKKMRPLPLGKDFKKETVLKEKYSLLGHGQFSIHLKVAWQLAPPLTMFDD